MHRDLLRIFKIDSSTEISECNYYFYSAFHAIVICPHTHTQVQSSSSQMVLCWVNSGGFDEHLGWINVIIDMVCFSGLECMHVCLESRLLLWALALSLSASCSLWHATHMTTQRERVLSLSLQILHSQPPPPQPLHINSFSLSPHFFYVCVLLMKSCFTINLCGFHVLLTVMLRFKNNMSRITLSCGDWCFIKHKCSYLMY